MTAPDAAAPPGAEGAKAPAPPPDPKLTPRFVELARREKAIVEREKATKDAAAQVAAFEAARVDVKKDPLRALKLLGIDLDTLVRRVAEPDAPETVEERVARIETERVAEREAATKAQTTAEAEAEARTIAAFQAQIPGALAGDDYELVSAEKAYGTVWDVIEAHYEATGQIMPIPEAGALVEAHLLEEAEKRLTAAKTSKKLGKLFAPAPPPPPPPPAPGAPAPHANPFLRGLERAAPAAAAPPPAVTAGSLAAAAVVPGAGAPAAPESPAQRAARIAEKTLRTKAG